MSFSPRLGLALSARLFSILAAIAVVAWHRMDTAHSSSTASMRRAYDAKAAALATKSRTGISLPEKEAEFRTALRKDDFVEASSLVSGVAAKGRAGYWSSSPLTDFINGVVDYNDPDMGQHLDAWVRNDKKSFLPLTVRAQYEYSIGWHFRGQGFYSEVKSADQIAFKSYMEGALSDVDAALKMQQDPPISLLYLKLQILESVGSLQDRQETFERAIKLSPNYYPIYQLMLSTLQPKWGGSVTAMYKFVETHADATDRYSALRLLYVELYKDIVDAASIECRGIAGTDNDKSACMSSMMDRFDAGQLQAKIREALLLYNHTDTYQFGAAIRQPILSIINSPQAGPYGSAILQITANVMRSDIRLFEAKPGQNNYVVDELVASSWYRAGNYENALRKDKEALEDLKRADFPNGEAADTARAEIYVNMSEAFGHLHDYAEQVVYERASYILGGRNGYEHAICFAFLHAGARDEVLPACDEAVAANTDQIATYYWRAQVRLDRKQGEEALPDLERVAGSRDDLRALSAIDLSMVWFARNDIRSALNVLNKYTYLYDETLTARDQIAVAYNNRCYAYMQLGDLRKALADCNKSLKYGGIPDAYAKKEELEKRLASLPI